MWGDVETINPSCAPHIGRDSPPRSRNRAEAISRFRMFPQHWTATRLNLHRRSTAQSIEDRTCARLSSYLALRITFALMPANSKIWNPSLEERTRTQFSIGPVGGPKRIPAILLDPLNNSFELVKETRVDHASIKMNRYRRLAPGP